MFEAAKQVMETLENAGFAAYAVGGFVRDTLLGLSPKDLDIATSANPEEIQGLFPGAKFLHQARFPVMVIGEFEIATFRRDVEALSRQETVVTMTRDVNEDAARRDLTINSLYMDVQGQVIDPTGLGLADLEAGLIRFVGDPLQRLEEDSTRALRAIRFASRFGFRLEDGTQQALRDMGLTLE